MNYKRGMGLTLILCVIVPLMSKEPVIELSSIIKNINPALLILACLAGYLAAMSFLVPYATLLMLRKRRVTSRNIHDILHYVYGLIVSGDADKRLGNELGLDTGIVKQGDLASLNVLWLLAFFTDKRLFYLVNSALILFLTARALKGKKLGPTFPTIVFACILRFLLEFPKTLLTFLALNIQLPLPTVCAFMIGSSVLYQFKAFPNAGGLLELYSTLFFALYGQPLVGLVLGLLFHLCALTTFVLPIRLLQKPNKIHKS